MYRNVNILKVCKSYASHSCTEKPIWFTIYFSIFLQTFTCFGRNHSPSSGGTP